MKALRNYRWYMAALVVLGLALLSGYGLAQDEGLVIGVILTQPAAEAGWDDIETAGTRFSEVGLNGQRVIFFENLNRLVNPEDTLEAVVEEMVQRGARFIFVPANRAGQQTDELAEAYPNVMFLSPSTRAQVDRLVAALAPARPAVRGGETELPVLLLALSAISFVSFLVVITAQALRGRPATPGLDDTQPSLHAKRMSVQRSMAEQRTNYTLVGEAPPMFQRMSTYVLGDDNYDESLGIETEANEYLGECGVAIAKTIGEGTPKHPTAFEVWLFDKNDAQTRTHIFVSAYSLKDATLAERARQSDGAVVLAEQNATTILETQTLRLRARVVAMQYGQEDALPPHSFFEQFVVELAVWPKAA